MGSRWDGKSEPLSGVHQYIPYITDGALVVLSLVSLAGVGFLTSLFAGKGFGFRQKNLPASDKRDNPAELPP